MAYPNLREIRYLVSAQYFAPNSSLGIRITHHHGLRLRSGYLCTGAMDCIYVNYFSSMLVWDTFMLSTRVVSFEDINKNN